MKDEYLICDWYILQWECLGTWSACLYSWGRHRKLLDVHSSWHWAVGSFFISFSRESPFYTTVWFLSLNVVQNLPRRMTLMFREETFSKGPDVKCSEKEMFLLHLKWLLRATLTICGVFTGEFAEATGAAPDQCMCPLALPAGQEEKCHSLSSARASRADRDTACFSSAPCPPAAYPHCPTVCAGSPGTEGFCIRDIPLCKPPS